MTQLPIFGAADAGHTTRKSVTVAGQVTGRFSTVAEPLRGPASHSPRQRAAVLRRLRLVLLGPCPDFFAAWAQLIHRCESSAPTSA